jgi:SAM-dependent methyltransferase
VRLTSLRWHWNTLGRRDPLNAILTRADRDPRWNVDEFFETGRGDVHRFLTHARRLMPDLQTRRALDFGCGVGRLTQALAESFDEVVGVDIAESMIAAARAYQTRSAGSSMLATPAGEATCRTSRPQGARFELNTKPDLAQFAGGTFDFILAWIVLQHMPPALMAQYLGELVRILTPGGLLLFQLPADVEDPKARFRDAPVVGGSLKRSLPRPLVRGYRLLKFEVYRRFVPHMEMYALPRKEVVDLVQRCGGEVKDVQPDQSHGPATPGFSYWVTKQRREARGARREGRREAGGESDL